LKDAVEKAAHDVGLLLFIAKHLPRLAAGEDQNHQDLVNVAAIDLVDSEYEDVSLDAN
jgi:hypothetical protein